jgi:putative NIF3 family GTP cyclohydrolase 1 type 2
MKSTQITRRQAIATVGATVAAAAAVPALGKFAFAQAPALPTAQQVVDLIKAHLNMEWNNKTYRDTFKSGDPSTPVKGIASCFMSTFEVIKKAHAQGLNFVISHEPTYWTDADLIEPIKNEALYHEKRSFIESNGMVVWRIHDHWHRFRPEPMIEGKNRLLRWNKDEQNELFHFPPTKLREVARQVAERMFTRSVRIVGNPDMLVTTLATGGHGLSQNIAAWEKADVSMSSEVREWETVEYARDLVASGAKKALILISHEAGEEEGMVIFSEWMKTIAPNIRTVFISTNDNMYLV